MIEDITFRTDRRAFHLHAGAAGDEEEHFKRSSDIGWKPNSAILYLSDLSERSMLNGIVLGASYENSQQLFADPDVRYFDAPGVGTHFYVLVTQFPGGVAYRNIWTTKGPTAAERQIKPKTQLTRFLRSETKSVNELI